MCNSNLTELILIVDRSGSMQSIQKVSQDRFNEFINGQKQLSGDCKVTLVQFDNIYEMLWNNIDLKDAPEYVLIPRGCTALYDAVGRTINSVGERLAKTPEKQRPGKILVVIITDGQENASAEFTAEKVKQMVEHQTTKYSWTFVYLGANQDAVLEANKINIQHSINYAANAKGVTGCYSTVAAYGTNFRNSGNIYDDSFNKNVQIPCVQVDNPNLKK